MEIRLKDINGITLISVEDLSYMLSIDSDRARKDGKDEVADALDEVIAFLKVCKEAE